MTVLEAIASVAYTTWLLGNGIAHIAYNRRGPDNLVTRAGVAIHRDLWPIVPGAWLYRVWDVATDRTEGLLSVIILISYGIGAWIWWKDRNWPDDTWKRRATKVLESVKVQGAKLVVVPT